MVKKGYNYNYGNQGQLYLDFHARFTKLIDLNLRRRLQNVTFEYVPNKPYIFLVL